MGGTGFNLGKVSLSRRENFTFAGLDYGVIMTKFKLFFLGGILWRAQTSSPFILVNVGNIPK